MIVTTTSNSTSTTYIIKRYKQLYIRNTYKINIINALKFYYFSLE